MDSRPRKFGTHQQRTELARAKLIRAAVDLTAERGLSGFSIAEAERRGGLKRGIAGYHFRDAEGLRWAVVAELLVCAPSAVELGLPQLLDWMRARLASATLDAPAALARARILISAPAAEFSAERQRYWGSEVAIVAAHLTQGKVLKQVGAALEPSEVAPIIVGQLHGEVARIVMTHGSASSVFLEMVERALSSPGLAATRAPRLASKSKTNHQQGGLFGDQ